MQITFIVKCLSKKYCHIFVTLCILLVIIWFLLSRGRKSQSKYVIVIKRNNSGKTYLTFNQIMGIKNKLN